MNLPQRARQTIMTYGPGFVAGLLVAQSRFPEQLDWTKGAYRRVFGYLAPLYDGWASQPGYGEAFNEALRQIDGIPKRILDLATGTGFAALRLKKLYPSAEVTGIDISPEMVAVARHNSLAEGLDVTFEVADDADLPFDDEWFDLVVMQNALPYANEMLRVATKGGTALLVYSYAGPWVGLVFSEVANSFLKAGATSAKGKRTQMGYVGTIGKAAP